MGIASFIDTGEGSVEVAGQESSTIGIGISYCAAEKQHATALWLGGGSRIHRADDGIFAKYPGLTGGIPGQDLLSEKHIFPATSKRPISGAQGRYFFIFFSFLALRFSFSDCFGSFFASRPPLSFLPPSPIMVSCSFVFASWSTSVDTTCIARASPTDNGGIRCTDRQ